MLFVRVLIFRGSRRPPFNFIAKLTTLKVETSKNKFVNHNGATENARPDNDRPPKTGDLTVQDLTLADHIAGVENARPGNGRPMQQQMHDVTSH